MKKIFLLITLFLLIFFSSADQWSNFDLSSFTSPGINCFKNSTYAAWVNVSSNSVITLLQEVFKNGTNVGNCSNYSSQLSIFCCPTNFLCNTQRGVCERELINYCSQQENKEDCEYPSTTRLYGRMTFISLQVPGYQFCETEVNYHLPNGDTCANETICSCFWNSTRNSCGFKIENRSFCGSTSSPSQLSILDNVQCAYTLVNKTDNCKYAGGKIILEFESVSNSSSSMSVICQRTLRKEYPCSNQVTLPFFDLSNFIFALILILGIYFFLRK
ncbi:MAG: hypothetical protein QW273_00305 [Candidatus Pacearchaeota archaeon]